MSEVKPCPFCGLDGETMDWSNEKDGDFIEHPNTGCVLSDVKCYDVKVWNTRIGETNEC